PEAPSPTQPPPPPVGTAAEQPPEAAEAGEGEGLVRLTRLLQSPKRSAQKAPNGGGGDEEFSDSASAFGSRQDLSGSGRVDTAPPAWLKPGEPCLVQQPQGAKLPGHVRFCGPTQFAAGTWVGVELNQPEGRNDGSVKGVKYFRCRARHGLFVRHDKVLQPRRRASQQMKTGKMRAAALVWSSPSASPSASPASPSVSPASPISLSSFPISLSSFSISLSSFSISLSSFSTSLSSFLISLSSFSISLSSFPISLSSFLISLSLFPCLYAKPH
ncbi:hypothetical protein BOX15_Mlig028298g1, partial [Macrostomum lignano]